MIKIGYQGDVGSNSEEAAQIFAKEQGLKEGEYELVPLVESRYVASQLKAGKIHYGVVATRNSVAGPVEETYLAIKDEFFEFVQTVILPIHHCVFARPGVKEEDISVVTSHIQALKQTKKNRTLKYPSWKEEEANDTAAVARNLGAGILPDNYAVICRKNAGEQYGLKLLCENIEDDRNNRTEFRVFKNPEMDYSGENKPSIWQWIAYQFASENGMSYIAQGIMIIGIIIAIFITQKFNLSAWEAASTVGEYTATVIIFFTSHSFRYNRRFKSLEGFWKYYSVSSKDIEGNDQKFTTPRIVKIV